MATQVITLSDFQNAVHPGLSNRYVQIGKGRHPNRISDIATVEGSTQAVEVHTIHNGLELMTMVQDGGVAPPDKFNQQRTKFFEHQEYKQSIVISRKMLDDGKAFPVHEKGTAMLGESYVESQNTTGHTMLNNGFSSELAADGVALFSASHLSTAGTTSNLLSTNAYISELSLEQVNLEIKKFKDDRGLRNDMRAVKVIGPVEIEGDMCRLLDNPERPGTADRDINYVNKKGVFPGGYMDDVYLSDPAAWFVQTTDNSDGLMFYNRIAFELKSFVDDETDNMTIRSYARWGYGVSKWSGYYASQGL